MALEIERKFLLTDDRLPAFLAKFGVNFRTLRIKQFYTYLTKNKEIRYRQENEKFIKTIKIGSGLIKEEFESECDENEFIKALEDKKGSMISKTRHCFHINNNEACIDIFNGDLVGLNTLEIEFKEELYAVFFRLKEPFLNFIIDDVSDKNEYRNRTLALLGNPDEKFDINFVKNVLENHQMSLNFPKNIDIKNALNIVFFKIYKAILSSDECSEIYKDARIMLTLLRAFDSVYDDKTTAHFSCEFDKFLDKFNPNYELGLCLDVLWDKKGVKGLKSFLQSAFIMQENMLKDQKNPEFLKEFELVLKEESSFFNGANADKKAINVVAYVLRYELVFIQKMLKNLNQNSKNEQFFKILNSVYKIYILLEFFGSFYQFKLLKKLKSKLDDMSEILNEIYSFDLLLKAVLNSFESSRNQSMIEAKIYEKTYKKREKILKKCENFKALCRKVSFGFKIYY